MLLIYAFLFVIGVCIGSFLNVVIDRLPAKRPILRGRSVCDSCHKQLTAFELIPIFSYLIQGGKCRHCEAIIPRRLIFVELLTGFLFVFTYFLYPSGFPLLILVMTVISANIAVFFIDLEYGIIPDELVFVITLASALLLFLFMPHMLLNHFIAAFLSFAAFLGLFLVTRGRGLGFGDVKYVFAMGLFLGFPLVGVAFYFAFLTGAAISIILIIYGKKGLKSAIPFGPFLVSGTLFAYFFGSTVIEAAKTYLGW